MKTRRPQPRLLELNAVLFLRRLSEKYSQKLTLSTIPPKEWQAIAAQGFDFVWLMGVWKRSPAARQCALQIPELQTAYDQALPDWTPEDVQGSPYAVYGYTLDSRLGNEKELPQLKESLNRAGLRLILDFVPNHLAMDHPRIQTHPDCFVRGTEEDFKNHPGLFFQDLRGNYFAHGKDPYFPSWKDTVQINYFSPVARLAADQELLKIAEVADGVRCDMAMLAMEGVFEMTWGKFLRTPRSARPKKEFWEEILGAVKKKYPQFLFMAEAYWDLEGDLQRMGFDFTYDKKLYDKLWNASPRDIKAHLETQGTFQEKSLHFIENHDERRAAEAFGREKSCAAAAVIATVPGACFFYDGQFEGKMVRLPIQLAREPKEPEDPKTAAFYNCLLKFINQPAFHEGVWQKHDVSPAWDANGSYTNLFCWSWLCKNHGALVVINYAQHPSQGRLHLPVSWMQEATFKLEDKLTGSVYDREVKELKEQGRYVDLGSWASHLFEFKWRTAPQEALEPAKV